MNGHGHPSALVSILIVALIAWRLYSRFRRSVGRQHLSKVRPWITVTLFPILTVLIVVTLAMANRPLATWALAALAGGIAIGIGLGIYGLRLTRFEVTETGLYYTPSAHLGIALSALLTLRILYRVLQGGFLSGMGTAGATAPPPTANSPLTLLFFGALAGYYTTYAIGLLRWRHSLTNMQPVAKPAEPVA